MLRCKGSRFRWYPTRACQVWWRYACLTSEYRFYNVSQTLVCSTSVPFIKDRCGDITDVNNYRGIAISSVISSVISNVLELVLLDRIEHVSN